MVCCWDGIPVACVATAANVNDTVLSERLFLAAFAVMAPAANASRFGDIRTVFADRGYDAESDRALCRSFGAEPHVRKRRQPSGSSLGKQRWPSTRAGSWCSSRSMPPT